MIGPIALLAGRRRRPAAVMLPLLFFILWIQVKKGIDLHEKGKLRESGEICVSFKTDESWYEMFYKPMFSHHWKPRKSEYGGFDYCPDEDIPPAASGETKGLLWR